MGFMDDFLGEAREHADAEAPPESVVAPEAPEPDPEFSIASTPAGLEVLYQWAPKRLYRVRLRPPQKSDEGWVEVSSVTTILDCLNKPGLPWWGMKIGVDGVRQLMERGVIRWDETLKMFVADTAGAGITPLPGPEDIVTHLTANKLTTNHVRDSAGGRGTAVHNALEVWAATGQMPDPSKFPAQEAGYVVGLVDFLQRSKLEAIDYELQVGSIEHGYAGRYDLRAHLPERFEHRINTRRVEVLEPGTYLMDLKTPKGVYPTHQFQLEAYEGASVECGYEPTDHRAVIRVAIDGTFEPRVSDATLDGFLAIKGAYDALKALPSLKERQ